MNNYQYINEQPRQFTQRVTDPQRNCLAMSNL